MLTASRRKVVIVGLGYVGLPLAVEAARAGLSVTGLDRSSAVLDGLTAGRSHVDDINSETVHWLLDVGFTVTSDPSVIGHADAVVVCVPTPLSRDGEPDLSAVKQAASTISKRLGKGTLVVLESTTYPGCTNEIFVPLLEAGGLVAGGDFHAAFSPERVDPGNPTYGIKNTPKVVGGYTPACTDAAVAFYEQFIDTVVRASGTREAEMAKLLENTYRHINIALVNEMARFSHDLDIDFWNVIDCASTKPFGFEVFRPGPGVGGHCIPIDPNYLSHSVKANLKYPFRFVELAEEINSSMPRYVARRIQDLLNDAGQAMRGSSILLLGVTYKANIADQRESPALPLVKRLRDMGARVSYHDPHVPTWDSEAGQRIERVADLDAALGSADISVLLQHHREYDADHLTKTARRLFDTRGITRSDQVARL